MVNIIKVNMTSQSIFDREHAMGSAVLEVDKLLLLVDFVDLNFFDFFVIRKGKMHEIDTWQVEENYILVHYDTVDTVKMVQIDQILCT